MDKHLARLDWALIQTFCAVAEAGSLSAAARRLGQSQPTTGRHVHALETALKVELFRREARGLAMTPAGEDIYADARTMKEAAARLGLTAAGQAQDMRGTVRITSSVIMAHFSLPPILAEIRARHPEISLELVPSDTTENLIFREADIAIRMYRPTQPDVVARHVGDRAIGLYGATSYLDHVGRPQTIDDLMRLDIVGYDKSDLIIRFMADFGASVTRDFFPLRCDDQAAHWHLVRAGCGIGGMQDQIAQNDTLVEKVLPELALPSLPVWLAAPDALHSNPRIRRVWDILAVALA